MNSIRGRRRLLLLVVGALVAFPLDPAGGATTTVIERGASFVPRQVDIAIGDTVVWSYESGPTDDPRHTVTFNDGTDLNPSCPAVLLSDCQDTPGETVQRRFAAPGTYPYFCKLHRNRGMVGVVVVTAATTTASSTTTSTMARATTTSSTARPSTTSSTTATTRPLATSSTIGTSSTSSSTTEPSSVLVPGDPPAFGDDTNANAAGQPGGSDEGSGTGTVALIVALLLGVSAAGGYLLWRLRPGRA